MGAGFEVVYVSGGRLLDAAESGRVDRETVRWALEVMGSAGVPDGMPVITVGTAIADVFWRWFRSMPVRMAPATRRKYAGHVRMFANFLAARGVAFGDLCEADIRAYALKRQSETAASSWKVEEAALMPFVRFCSEQDSDGFRVFDVNRGRCGTRLRGCGRRCRVRLTRCRCCRGSWTMTSCGGSWSYNRKLWISGVIEGAAYLPSGQNESAGGCRPWKERRC